MIIPLLCTCARIVVAPIVAYTLIYEQWATSLALVIFAGITDFLDGFFARLLQQTSHVGAVLDPIADKLFLFGVFVGSFFALPHFPIWFLYIVLSKELILLGGGMYMFLLYPGFTIRPVFSAKLLTALQFIFFAGAFTTFMLGYTMTMWFQNSVIIVFASWHLLVLYIYGKQVQKVLD